MRRGESKSGSFTWPIQFQYVLPVRDTYEDYDSTCPQVKRPEFCKAGLNEVVENVDSILVHHVAQLKKRLVWLQIHVDDLLCDLLGAGEGRDHGVV